MDQCLVLLEALCPTDSERSIYPSSLFLVLGYNSSVKRIERHIQGLNGFISFNGMCYLDTSFAKNLVVVQMKRVQRSLVNDFTDFRNCRISDIILAQIQRLKSSVLAYPIAQPPASSITNQVVFDDQSLQSEFLIFE